MFDPFGDFAAQTGLLVVAVIACLNRSRGLLQQKVRPDWNH